jgi:hypothetical protein
MQTHLRYKYPCAASRIALVFFLLKLALVTRRILILAAIKERFVEARLRGLVENFTDVFIKRSVVEVPQYETQFCAVVEIFRYISLSSFIIVCQRSIFSRLRCDKSGVRMPAGV